LRIAAIGIQFVIPQGGKSGCITIILYAASNEHSSLALSKDEFSSAFQLSRRMYIDALRVLGDFVIGVSFWGFVSDGAPQDNMLAFFASLISTLDRS